MQLTIWCAACLEKIRTLNSLFSYEDLHPLTGWTIVGHGWKLYLAWKEGGRLDMNSFKQTIVIANEDSGGSWSLDYSQRRASSYYDLSLYCSCFGEPETGWHQVTGHSWQKQFIKIKAHQPTCFEKYQSQKSIASTRLLLQIYLFGTLSIFNFSVNLSPR